MGPHIESTLRDSLTMSQANHFVAILPGGDPDARRAAPDQQHSVVARLTGSERQNVFGPLAATRTIGPLPCKKLDAARESYETAPPPRRCSTLFYFYPKSVPHR